MDPSSSKAHQDILKKQREQFRAQIAADEDEEFAPYERYVSWLTEQARTNPQGPFDLEILTVLEEAARSRKDDPDYKNDAAYIKLWLAYAKRVEKPDLVYVYLLKNEIGGKNPQLYEDYAVSLENQDRFREAEEAYRLGISRSKRGLDRLKSRHQELRKRVEANNTLKSTRRPPHIPSGESSSLGAKLYRNPLRNIKSKHSSTSSVSAPSKPTTTSDVPAPAPKPSSSSAPKANVNAVVPEKGNADSYSYMKSAMDAPVAPGKRAEKYRFDMTLLFKDGKEYCIQEARAASLGLLGKKWGPPPMSEPGPHQPPAMRKAHAHADGHTNGSRPATKTGHLRLNTNMTAQLAMEPTVTLNTKEALKDVYLMYNSPERTMKSDLALGSKHAPVKKLEPLFGAKPKPQPKPRGELRMIAEKGDDEGEQSAPKSATFRPFVDDENKKENTAPTPVKFKPFVDENVDNKTPHITPKPRKALAAKDVPPVTPIHPHEEQQEESQSENEPEQAIIPQEPHQQRSVFSRVFTPVSQTEKARPALQPRGIQERPAVFRDVQPQVNGNATAGGSTFGSKVFSRPPDARPQSLAHSRAPLGESLVKDKGLNDSEPVFSRSTSAPQRLAFTPVSRERQPLAFVPHRTPVTPIESSSSESELEPELEPEPGVEESDEVEDYGEDYESQSASDENVDGPEGEGEYYDDEEPHTMPMGGRLGAFEVMTPIAERTFECTITTRTLLGTPSDKSGPILDRGISNHDRDAALAAEKLAQELRDEEAKESERERENEMEKERERDVDMNEVIDIEDESSLSEVDDFVEKTGTLSLADAIAVASSFKPSNPCNPSDPHIVNTLLSLIPLEPDFHDLRTEVSGRLESLRKFAAKCARRGSGRSVTRISDGGESFRVRLPNSAFVLSDKLGEGGFGMVFKAKAVDPNSQSDDEDMDSDDEDSDEEESNMFALKAVKPRNIWEFHILRRLHSVLPAPCRRSIVSPHALYCYRDESFLVLDLCTQGTLLDVVNHATDAGVSQQGACLDELLVMFFAIELLKFVENMHKVGFIHGDLKIDNCLLRLEEVPGGSNAWSGMYQSTGEGGWSHKGIKMIDFGRTIDTRMYPSGQKFIADWKTTVNDCLELRENRPWTYETDYFGLAGIIYCLLFGKFFEVGTVVPIASTEGEPVRYRLTPAFKRYWQGELWSRLFDVLLNPTLVRPDRSLPLVPELVSLRGEMETWLSSNCNRSSNTLKGLLKKVERSTLAGSK